MKLINNIPSIVKEVTTNDWYRVYQVENNELKLNTVHVTSIEPMSLEAMQKFFVEIIKAGYYYTSDNDRILKLPEVGTEYWYIYIDRGASVSSTTWSSNQHDIERFAVGNCFLDIESVYDAVSIIQNPFIDNNKKFAVK